MSSSALLKKSDAVIEWYWAHGVRRDDPRYSVSRGMEFQLSPRGFYPAVSDFPKASPLARWQASCGFRVTNQRHENVLLGFAEKALMERLDGSQSRRDLEAHFQEARLILEHFARVALLVS